LNPLLAEIITARKTFFITPDLSLFPKNYLEEYLMHGFETYFIENDKICPIEKKVDIIRRVFQDSILFFNIDAIVPGIVWPNLISELQKSYGNTILIGVVYAKRRTLEERLALEKYYLYDIGIKCGCVQLEYRRKSNFGIIEKTLYANQAMGRRKCVRALCGNGCTFTFLENGTQVTGIMYDLSLSHFTGTVPDTCSLKENEKLCNIQFNIQGLHIRSDAILYLKRVSDNGVLYVFTFINRRGEIGLDVFVKQLLTPKLYEIMSDNCKSILNRLFYKQDTQN
jgi:hypothetical protein